MSQLQENAEQKLTDRKEIPDNTHHANTHGGTSAVPFFNLTNGSPFSPSEHSPPAFITMQFSGASFHAYTTTGRWLLDRLAAENSTYLIRSHKMVCRPRLTIASALEQRILKDPVKTRDPGDDFEKLILQFGPRSFLFIDSTHLVSYATSHEEAERRALEFAEKYQKPLPPNVGSYYLIKNSNDWIRTHGVPLKSSMLLDDELMTLQYGEGFQTWHAEFAERLVATTNGISIFEGSPGTGKTSYIRHLICQLENTHRFYFIPTVNLDILSRPDFIDFWTEQARKHPSRQFVIILEDAENALVTRGTDNARWVSAILNLTDGILADFLQLQFICTINCPITDIDSAFLRPGRLLSHRNFRKLNRQEGETLATSLGKSLEERQEYTLADIYAQPSLSNGNVKRIKIGFAT